MSLKKSLESIRTFVVSRYKNNLVALIIFGSANTERFHKGHFHEGKSDIDAVIFVKKLGKLNTENEKSFLITALKKYNFRTQYFHTIQSIKDYVTDRVSWSTRITLLSSDGSLVLYSTPEYKKLKRWLLKNFSTHDEIKNYLRKKDEFELNGYFKDLREFQLTKALMAHIRRKLQVLNYFKTKKLIFDYETCLKNIAIDQIDSRTKGKLQALYNTYGRRKKLSQNQIREYYTIAKQFTKKTVSSHRP